MFGARFLDVVRESRWFLVGAGAIGCEMLKNWALMGVGSKGSGQVTVTDMDTIERSNLNRQFLFRSRDVQKLKSDTASAAAVAFNPDLNVKSFSTRVGGDTEHVFNDDFMGQLTGVCNALDNVDARMYCRLR